MSSASSSFDALVSRHARDVARVCGAVLRDPHLAADASQETFLRLWSRMSKGRPPEAAGGWLRRVALSTALDSLRRRRSGAPVEETPDAEALAERPSRGPETAAACRELDACFEAALATLPAGQRTVFLLRHVGGLPLSEVADTLGLALPTVKTHFARAALKLQARLSAFRDETGQAPASPGTPAPPPDERAEP